MGPVEEGREYLRLHLWQAQNPNVVIIGNKLL